LLKFLFASCFLLLANQAACFLWLTSSASNSDEAFGLLEIFFFFIISKEKSGRMALNVNHSVGFSLLVS